MHSLFLSDTPPPKRQRRPSGIDFLLSKSPDKPESQDELELQSYLLDKSDFNKSPLEWWSENETKYPRLSIIAKRVLAGVSDDETEGYIKAVKNSLKINASKYIPILCKKITSDSSSCKTVVQYRDCCLAYIENCVNLCYYAAVQDPPMVIDFVPGKIFDKQSWKEYSRSGTEVEYVVWPALYLYKGGPIMTKGVVQPKENTP
ncbi:unnamed protein product [Mytilus edulis]|uniref:Mitochondria-eating protein C-terminal domain-containing protein n=1 Tax=Mytilus edulis TaxID=6550 RepID=A0A8S3RTN4_MYTED|nr:unnamed protein product [Mytilus edulis]